jgi:hypothetical protein
VYVLTVCCNIYFNSSKIASSDDFIMKIRRRKSRKRYLGKKNVYEYDALCIGIPSRFRKDVAQFLDKDLKMSLKAEKNRIVIILEPRENLSVNRKTFGENM